MEPIRVLQISYDMNLGGAETLIMNLYRNIDREKIQFDFLLHSPERSTYEDEIETLGGRIFHIPRFLGFNALSYDKQLRIFLQKHPEYIIIHDHLMDSAAHTLKICKQYGRTTIAHSHTANITKTFSELIRSIFRKNLWKIADYRFACSESAGKWLYRNKAAFTILRNGIMAQSYAFDPETRKKVREEFGVDDATLLIGTVGRLIEYKNQIRLIEVFNQILQSNPNTMLMIVGQGPLENRIKAKIIECGLTENVILTGARKDVNQLLMGMDRFVLPSLFEGLGIVLVEAQASGLPCIFTDTLPSEVNLITALLHRVRLDSKNSIWADEIVKAEGFENRDCAWETVRDRGYDIKTSAGEIQTFYLSIADNRDIRKNLY